ncbi:MAG: sugar isomerase domain-containing protein, partial [Oscillospiraceae bacterium]|nr:sugar isomerase domain-containing protein [Oscillospiraceae bacterium]
MIKHIEYLNNLSKIISDITESQSDNIEKAAVAFSDALTSGHNIFLFGTGHSSLLSQEIFYRAGGLVNIRPVLNEDLMLHISASESTEKERLPGYAEKLFSEYNMKSGDIIVIISNSGRNEAAVDLALKCKENSLTVVALTNIAHSSSSLSRHVSGKRLFEIA